MSVYSKIEGTINVRKDAHVSIKKIVTDVDPYAIVNVQTKQSLSNENYFCHDVYICVDAEGEYAIPFVRKFIEMVKEKDPSCFIDIESTIRWYS